DAAGNVYALGDLYTDSNYMTGGAVIREKPVGSSAWSTIANLPFAACSGLAVDGAGDLFFSNGDLGSVSWTTWELRSGTSTPVKIDDAGPGYAGAVAIDPAGNLYVGGEKAATTNNSLDKWTMRKGTFNSVSGTWSFITVDQITTKTE